jgi:hypothetical protein
VLAQEQAPSRQWPDRERVEPDQLFRAGLAVPHHAENPTRWPCRSARRRGQRWRRLGRGDGRAGRATARASSDQQQADHHDRQRPPPVGLNPGPPVIVPHAPHDLHWSPSLVPPATAQGVESISCIPSGQYPRPGGETRRAPRPLVPDGGFTPAEYSPSWVACGFRLLATAHDNCIAQSRPSRDRPVGGHSEPRGFHDR